MFDYFFIYLFVYFFFSSTYQQWLFISSCFFFLIITACFLRKHHGWMDGRTDGWTDHWTDWRTDRPSWTHLKMKNWGLGRSIVCVRLLAHICLCKKYIPKDWPNEKIIFRYFFKSPYKCLSVCLLVSWSMTLSYGLVWTFGKILVLANVWRTFGKILVLPNV